MTLHVSRDAESYLALQRTLILALALVSQFGLGTSSWGLDDGDHASHAAVMATDAVQHRLRESCIDCHSGAEAEARLDLDVILREPLAVHLGDWRKLLRVLRDGTMPPVDADGLSPHDRAVTTTQVRQLIARAAQQHASDPGPTQVRRLTSAEFDYCLEDLTGIPFHLGRQFVSDNVGGSGFANAASAQFLQDSLLERYLEAARIVADHAVIGAGPIYFIDAAGPTGVELSAIRRLQDLYRRHGFRASAGEGALPYGLDCFPKAMEVAWKYRHRRTLGMDGISLEQLAHEAELDFKFVEHLWLALNRSDAKFPLNEIVSAWNALPNPASDGAEDATGIEKACQELFQLVQSWQERFAGAASAEEEAAVLTGGDILIPEQRDFLVRARRKRLRQDNNFTPDLNNTRLYSSDGAVRLQISVELASEQVRSAPNVILRKPLFQFRYIDRVNPDPVPLHTVLTPRSLAELRLGENPGGEPVAEDEFVVTAHHPKTVEVVLPPSCNLGQLIFVAELDSVTGRDSVVRCMIDDVTEESASNTAGRHYSSLLRDPTSQAMKQWESGVTEFAQTFPQISHREPAPSDRDPIPDPYDNDYNVPERNYFHTAVKYHRDDEFLTRYLVTPSERQTLDQAWADLLLSFDYHDINLRFVADKFGVDLPSSEIALVDWELINSLPPSARGFLVSYKSHYEAMVELMQSAEAGHLEDLELLATRAWRRPLSDSERRDLHAFYRHTRAEEQLPHQDAVRSTITRILVSPEFLFRIEKRCVTEHINENITAHGKAPEKDRALSGYELANRLSFSLWSSLPDVDLLTLAQRSELQHEAVLEQQVLRMLASPKSRRMATEFFGQWLGFYQFDRYRGVDEERFPEFDESLRQSLYQEAINFCEHLIVQDRPYHELIEADYGFFDRRVAEHYGLSWPDQDGPGFQKAGFQKAGPQKVSLSADHPRGGVLGLGAILISTSAPLRTSPVKRGDWILRRLLDTPVPPPPADAGSIPADDVLSDGKTIRERLDAHRDHSACRGCHSRIDPLGFALENSASLGRWRDTYRDGQPIDTGGILENGQPIDGLDELKAHLRSRDEDLRRTLASRLTAYMLGRPETIPDAALIQRVCDQLEVDPRFSSAVRTIILSPQFRRIRVDAASGADTVSSAKSHPQHDSSGPQP